MKKAADGHGRNFTEWAPIVELGTGLPVAPDDACPPWGRWNWKIDKGYIYIWVLYWTITTMTTIGYGDFSPTTCAASPKPNRGRCLRRGWHHSLLVWLVARGASDRRRTVVARGKN